MTLADIAVPHTAVTTAALEVATSFCSPALLNHSVRSYLWGAAWGTMTGIEFDRELLYVAAILHDVGLVPEFDNHQQSFEVTSGHVAVVFAAGAGWPRNRRIRLAEVIVRHMWPEVDVDEDPEGHLLELATAVDITGHRVDEFPRSLRAAVLDRYPRAGISSEFVACLEEQARRKPESSAAEAIGRGLADAVARNPLDA
jgi:HD domain-containing protein